MKNKRYYALIIFLFTLLTIPVIWGFGFFGHKKINRIGVFTLPPELVGFYKSHIDFITEHAVDPDKRRYAVEGEAARHYIDIDHYGHKDSIFIVMPKKWKDAVEKYSEDTLKAYGIIPWHIENMMYKLTNAFTNKDVDAILRLSADFGHYVADAHVPLHTTENYNGQLTNQKGIHGLWESRLVELFYEDYDFFTGRAEYIENPLEYAWQIVWESHQSLDSVLSIEKNLTETIGDDKKYSFESRGLITTQVYSEEFSKAYHEALNGMVERRMKKAVKVVGSMWLTAWINAGKPDLSSLKGKELNKETLEELKKEEEKFLKGKEDGKELGRDHGL